MRLVGFRVENFRSITTGEHIQIGGTTILIGPNNEGKSNLVRALATALGVASRGTIFRRSGKGSRRFLYRGHQDDYDWERDFPKQLQADDPTGKSKFRLEFELEDPDRNDFQREFGTQLTSNLTIEIHIGPPTEALLYDIKLRGPAKKKLSQRQPEIAGFIAKRLDFEYIPTQRGARESETIVSRLFSKELELLEKDPEYAAAKKKLHDIELKAARQLAKKLEPTLKELLPTIKDLGVEFAAEQRRNEVRLLANDGILTPLDQKGDGVQSLAAIAFMRHSKRALGTGRKLILLVEEPESHLHSDSIHGLKASLAEIAKSHQLVYTTHSNILVEREAVGSNVIVKASQAKPAGSLGEIRAALGVRMSENLVSADIVLLVEGNEDKVILEAYLGAKSPKLRKAIMGGTLVIEPIGGSGNLLHRARMHKTNLCNVHVLVDGDDSGKKELEKAIAEGVLKANEHQQVMCPGLDSCEIEDLLDPAIYTRGGFITASGRS